MVTVHHGDVVTIHHGDVVTFTGGSTAHSPSGMYDLSIIWVKLAPNGTNLGLFKIKCTGAPKCTETDLKSLIFIVERITNEKLILKVSDLSSIKCTKTDI